MFIINYSQELLFITLAVCALALTIALVWFLYYLILAAKDVRQASTIILDQAMVIQKWIRLVKKNLSVGLAVAGVVKEAASSAKDFFTHWQESRKTDKVKEDIFS